MSSCDLGEETSRPLSLDQRAAVRGLSLLSFFSTVSAQQLDRMASHTHAREFKVTPHKGAGGAHCRGHTKAKVGSLLASVCHDLKPCSRSSHMSSPKADKISASWSTSDMDVMNVPGTSSNRNPSSSP